MELDLNLMRQIIIDHYENPRYKIENASALKNYQSGHNDSPSCIDNIDAFIKIKDNKIKDIKFLGIGCAICTSSTDIMAKNIIGLDVKKAKDIMNNYMSMIVGNKYDKELLNDLVVYQNVNKQANRVKCALTGIQAIMKAIDNEKK